MLTYVFSECMYVWHLVLWFFFISAKFDSRDDIGVTHGTNRQIKTYVLKGLGHDILSILFMFQFVNCQL